MTTTTIPSFFTAAAAASSSSSSSSKRSKSKRSKSSKSSTRSAAAAKAKGAAAAAKPVRAILRVRPLLKKKESAEECLHIDPANPAVVYLDDLGVRSKFKLDHCLPSTATQEDVFAHVRPMLDGAMRGLSATVFAYGMTGSGKTHTMEGNDKDHGVVYRSAQYLFERVKETKASGAQAEVHLLMFELCKYEFGDLLKEGKLLGSGSGKGKAKAKDDAAHVPSGPGSVLFGAIRTKLVEQTTAEYRKVQAIAVGGFKEFETLFRRGLESRATGATNFNEKSSRSHLIVQLVVASRSSPNGNITFAKVNLVDLAGSENNKGTGNTGERLKESVFINKSLLNLRKVVAMLNSREPAHVPYTTCKLTMVLRDSLGGNAHGLIIANAGPSVDFARETKATLAFAASGSKIAGVPVANTVVLAPVPPPPTAPKAPSSRKRSAPTDSTPGDPSPPSPKRPRTDLCPNLIDLQANVDPNMDAEVDEYSWAKLAFPRPPLQPHAMSRAPAHAPSPRTTRLVAQDAMDAGRKHARAGNLDLARTYFASVLANSAVDPATRDACARLWAECSEAVEAAADADRAGASASASATPGRKSKFAAGLGGKEKAVAGEGRLGSPCKTAAGSSGRGKGKRRRVVDDSDDDVAVLSYRTSNGNQPAAGPAATITVDLRTPVSKAPRPTSALAHPLMSYTLPDSDDDVPMAAPNSPSASKSSAGRAKRARSSGTPPDFSMSPAALAFFLELVNCGDPGKISARFAGLTKMGKAKLIVDHVTMHGGIRTAGDLLGIVGFGEKTVSSMVETARAAVGERAVGEVVGKENVGGGRPRKSEGKRSGSGSGSGGGESVVMVLE